MSIAGPIVDRAVAEHAELMVRFERAVNLAAAGWVLEGIAKKLGAAAHILLGEDR